jgi:hypothetical protein
MLEIQVDQITIVLVSAIGKTLAPSFNMLASLVQRGASWAGGVCSFKQLFLSLARRSLP